VEISSSSNSAFRPHNGPQKSGQGSIGRNGQHSLGQGSATLASDLSADFADYSGDEFSN
jgi:hypothetical protein